MKRFLSLIIPVLAVFLFGCFPKQENPLEPQVVQPETPTVYPALFGSTPANATFTITTLKGGLIGTVAAQDTFRLPQGVYSYTVSKDGYESQTGVLQVAEGLTSTTNVALTKVVVSPKIPQGTIAGPDTTDTGVSTLFSLSSDALKSWNNYVGDVSPNGSFSVTFPNQGLYVVACQLWGTATFPGNAQKIVYVRGPKAPQPPVPATATINGSTNGTMTVAAETKVVTLHLASTNGRYAFLTGIPGFAPFSGDITLTLSQEQTTFVYTVFGDAETLPAVATLSVTRGTPPPAPKPTVSITASAATVTKGNPVTLAVSATNADYILVLPVMQIVSGNNGTLDVFPAQPTTYQALAIGKGGVDLSSISVNVTDVPKPPNPTASIATPDSVDANADLPVGLASTNGISAVLTPYGVAPLNETVTTRIAVTTTFVYTVTGQPGTTPATVQKTVVVRKKANPTASIAAPDSVDANTDLTAALASQNGVSATLSNYGAAPLNGTVTMRLTATTTLLFTVTGQPGTTPATASKTVVVRKKANPTASIATPDSVNANADFIIGLASTNGTAAVLTPYGVAPLNGTVTTRITATTTFVYTVTGQAGTMPATASKTVVVRALIVTPPANPGATMTVADEVLADVSFPVALDSENGVSADLGPNYGPAPLSGTIMLQFGTPGPVTLTYRVNGQPGTTPAMVVKTINVVAIVTVPVTWDEKVSVTLNRGESKTVQLHNPAGTVYLQIDREYVAPCDPQLGFDFVDAQGRHYTPVIAYTGNNRTWTLVLPNQVELPANLTMRMIYQGTEQNTIKVYGFRGTQ